MPGRLPNLLIIGAMKSGTSSLHEYLNVHPDIFMSEPKEIHYYADASYNKLSKDDYMQYFDTDCKIAGTTPQSYTKCHNKYYRNIPERIFKDSPGIKMIYILRDPVKRYASHILESYHCDPKEDIAYSKESDNYMKTGLYGMQLAEYLKYFNRSQIYILTLEDLMSNRLETLNKIFDFLGVKRLEDESKFRFISNSAGTKSIPTVIRDNIIYRVGMRISARATRYIGARVAKIYFHKLMVKPVLTDEQKERLKKIYREDLKLLRQLSGMEFKQWDL